METKHTFSIDFIPRRCKQDKSFAYLYARVTVDGDHREISTKEKIPMNLWNSKKEKLDGRGQEYKAVNESIDNIRFRIKEHYRKLKDKNMLVTAQMVKDAYEGVLDQLRGHSLLELIGFHKKIEEPKLKKGTVKNYGATKAYLQKFIQHKLLEGLL